MENQHRKIKGYRELDAQEIHLMNTCKEMGEKLKGLIGMLRENETVDQRWVSIAETHLQQGVMSAVRSVAKPDSF
ncbi:hypothetical protein HOP38_02595 [Vibrio mediterranei]|uniref:Acb2/Tad1 domain-containing protein n=1 Tax=Vibrio mediterranei TaxID=689 RepID=UPI0018462343|nr:hypothetical protein [Vibrio mediterranei]NUW71399.1 hypothetical protein [Vibrio mediterranei]